MTLPLVHHCSMFGRYWPLHTGNTPHSRLPITISDHSNPCVTHFSSFQNTSFEDIIFTNISHLLTGALVKRWSVLLVIILCLISVNTYWKDVIYLRQNTSPSQKDGHTSLPVANLKPMVKLLYRLFDSKWKHILQDEHYSALVSWLCAGGQDEGPNM